MSGVESSYQLIGEEGPDHNKSFTVEAADRNDQVMGQGSGRTKKAAEQEAAYEAILKLRKVKGQVKHVS